MLIWPPHDPDAILDYQIDWAAWLGGDTIVTSDWEIVTDLVTDESPTGSVEIDSDEFTDDTATVWLSGGVHGEICHLTNRITTAGDRTMDQTVRLQVRHN